MLAAPQCTAITPPTGLSHAFRTSANARALEVRLVTITPPRESDGAAVRPTRIVRVKTMKLFRQNCMGYFRVVPTALAMGFEGGRTECAIAPSC